MKNSLHEPLICKPERFVPAKLKLLLLNLVSFDISVLALHKSLIVSIILINRRFLGYAELEIAGYSQMKSGTYNFCCKCLISFSSDDKIRTCGS
jgi:hypothetical protein